MGCNFVMAIPYNLPETFDECEGDAAAPPGLYPQPDGSTSTFRQRYTGTWTQDATTTGIFTVGKTVTPEAPFTYPATSACTTYSSVSSECTGWRFSPTEVWLIDNARVLADGINTADYAVNTVISQGVIIGSSNPNPSAATGSRSMTNSASSAMTTGASSASAGASSNSMTGAMQTTARATGAQASGAATTPAANASGSGGSSAAIRGSSIDGNVLAVAGLTVAGAIAGMALLL
jgi:hypothetical protein